jgi:hypothetical protein
VATLHYVFKTLDVAAFDAVLQQRASGGATAQVRYFIISLPPRLGTRALLPLVRMRWRIENRLQYVRDVTLGEDACQVLAHLRLHGWTNMAAPLRHGAWTPCAALQMLGLVPILLEGHGTDQHVR